MTYPTAEINRLRDYLADPIPAGGSDADCFFNNDQITDLLNFTGLGPNSQADLYASAAEGWERKASAYAELVTTQTGGSTRNMSDLRTHAEARAKHFRELADRRTFARSGTIVRPGTTLR